MYQRYGDTNYKIGMTPDALIPLKQMGVPIPDSAPGDTASSYYVRADMMRVGDGFAHVAWVWDVISRTALANVLSFLDDSDSKFLYVRTNITTGVTHIAANEFKIYYAVMHRPILTGDEGSPVARSMHAYQSVKVQFISMVEQPGYL